MTLPQTYTTTVNHRSVAVTIDFVGDRVGCTSITVTADDGSAITGEHLRRLPVARLVAEAAALFHVNAGLFLEPPEGFPKSGPTDEALKYIADVYQAAYAAGRPPTKAVAELGLTYPTAARWVTLARAAAYLERTKPGRTRGRPTATVPSVTGRPAEPNQPFTDPSEAPHDHLHR